MPKKPYINYEEKKKFKEMDNGELFDIAQDEGIEMLTFSQWKKKYPHRAPEDHNSPDARSKYTKSQLDDYDTIDDLRQLSIGLSQIKMNSSKNTPVFDTLSNHLDNIAIFTKTADEMMKTGNYASTEDPEEVGKRKFHLGIAGLGAFKNWLQADDNFNQVMDGLDDAKYGEQNRKNFLKTLQRINKHCKANIDIDGMLIESKYSHLLTSDEVKEKSPEEVNKEGSKYEAKGYNALDSKTLGADLDKQGWFNKGSSAEHEKLVRSYKAFNAYMEKMGANADPEKKNKYLNDLRTAAEEYVSVKRDGRWNNNPNWKPTTPSGEKRFDAAMAIIDMTRNQLGMKRFTSADHNKVMREYEKKKYAPKDFEEGVKNCLKGRRDQFKLTNETKKLREDYERDQIAKLLNEGKPKTKEGVEHLREAIAIHASRILAMNYIDNHKVKGFTRDEEGISELARQMREGKPFERLMAANKGWEGAVKLGTESLGTSYKLERNYNNNVKAEREVIKNTSKKTTAKDDPYINVEL